LHGIGLGPGWTGPKTVVPDLVPVGPVPEFWDSVPGPVPEAAIHFFGGHFYYLIPNQTNPWTWCRRGNWEAPKWGRKELGVWDDWDLRSAKQRRVEEEEEAAKKQRTDQRRAKEDEEATKRKSEEYGGKNKIGIGFLIQ